MTARPADLMRQAQAEEAAERLTAAIDRLESVIPAVSNRERELIDAALEWRAIDRAEWNSPAWWDATTRLRDRADRMGRAS